MPALTSDVNYVVDIHVRTHICVHTHTHTHTHTHKPERSARAQHGNANEHIFFKMHKAELFFFFFFKQYVVIFDSPFNPKG